MSVGNALLFNTNVAFFTGLLLQKKMKFVWSHSIAELLYAILSFLDCFNANLIQGISSWLYWKGNTRCSLLGL